MIVRPAILPDELDRSYLGRFMRLNGKRNEKEAMDLATAWMGDSEMPGRDLTKVELLSKVGGLDVRKFVCRHTTLPLRRSIAHLHRNVPHGEPTCSGLLRVSAMRVARSGSYFCEECAKWDLKIYGTSYWHRSHQIPGQYWCPEHGSPLYFVDDERAFLASPIYRDIKARQINSEWVASLKSREVHQKFLDICFALMDLDSPCNSNTVGSRLRRRIIDCGLVVEDEPNQSQFLWRHLRDLYDKTWLQEVLSLKGSIKDLRAGNWVETILSPSLNTQLLPQRFILAASFVCEDSDDAVAMFTAKYENKGRSPRVTEAFVERLKSSYLRNYGNHGAVATELKMSLLLINNKLERLGLPDFAVKDDSAFRFAWSFYGEGKSLHDSQYLSGVSNADMESVLRSLTGSFANALCDAISLQPQHE